MQAKFYKTALTLDQKHSILMNNPLALCHDFFGGFIVALACVALWRGHMRCRMLTSFLLTACHNLSYRHVEMRCKRGSLNLYVHACGELTSRGGQTPPEVGK